MTTPTHSPSIMDETELCKPIVIGERCYDVQADVAAELTRLREQNRQLRELVSDASDNMAGRQWTTNEKSWRQRARAALAEKGQP